MPWFDCSTSLVDLHSSALRRNSALSVPVGGHRCTVTLPGMKKRKGKCLFSKTRDNSDSLDSETQVLESRQWPCRSIKSPGTRVNIIIGKRRSLAGWWFWWWIRSTLQPYTQPEGLVFAGWQFVMLSLFFFLAPALFFFFTALSKIWILAMTHVCQWP